MWSTITTHYVSILGIQSNLLWLFFVLFLVLGCLGGSVRTDVMYSLHCVYVKNGINLEYVNTQISQCKAQ